MYYQRCLYFKVYSFIFCLNVSDISLKYELQVYVRSYTRRMHNSIPVIPRLYAFEITFIFHIPYSPQFLLEA